ncbi:MAG: GGDEF domain-containing protein [Burkholderiaceae bacterium]|nr:GGDEF domain-containing protein [Burkholderiaceae bacterium]
MPLLDPRTAILLIGIMSGLMSLVVFALKRNYPPSIQGLREWGAALLVIFFGGLLAAGRGKFPEFLTTAAPNFLLCSGIYLLYVGSQRFFGETPHPWPWMALITGVLLITMWFTWIEPSYVVRLRWVTALMGLLFTVHAALLLRQGRLTFSKLLATLVLTMIAAIQIFRLVTTFTLATGNDILDSSPQHAFFIASFSSSILLFAISTVLMASDRLHAEMEHLATHDSLTNAFTRRSMNEACARELERSRRSGHKMALMILDLDHFKAINDTYGHQAGDRVLIDVVTQIKALLRKPDQLGRFGGEEFVVLLPETTLEEAIVVAERIRESCARSEQKPSCTVSIGITTSHKDSDTVDSLLARADAALYHAKSAGRNRVETG